MERTSKIVLDPEKLNMLDAIYLSHAHTDHIDPYTLIEIYKYANPILILPITLRYLEELFINIFRMLRLNSSLLSNHTSSNELKSQGTCSLKRILPTRMM